MRITRLSAASGFTPPGHFDMKAFVLQASGQGGHLTLVRSVFLPGGRAEYSVSSQEMYALSDFLIMVFCHG